MESIASAPTFYSGNKAQSALNIIQKYELADQLPSRLLKHLESQTQLKDDAERYVDTNELLLPLPFHVFFLFLEKFARKMFRI